MPVALLLYTRDGCELCEQAQALFESLQQQLPELGQRFVLQKVDIAQDTGLEARYGLSIPVLERSDNHAQLNWPFPPSRLRDFLKNP